MKLADKAARIIELLDGLYPVPPIPLEHADPFTLLVAVVLSAQTTDKKVNQVTPRLFAVAPTPEALAVLEVEEIRQIIREVGLAPQKAKALKGLAEQLVRDHGGQVPGSFDALVALPGVGQKTANVVLSQAFGVPAFPVDTHIHRLAARWGLSKAKTADKTELDLRRIFPEHTWNRLHLQIIYFGREHCPALRHDPAGCLICSWAAPKVSRRATKAPKAPARVKGKKRDEAGVDPADRRAVGARGARSARSRARPG
ncbi:endonuclease III [Myxococcota bacterium]|nr:endonuclease III [Myxococcota bacterium]